MFTIYSQTLKKHKLESNESPARKQPRKSSLYSIFGPALSHRKLEEVFLKRNPSSQNSNASMSSLNFSQGSSLTSSQIEDRNEEECLPATQSPIPLNNNKENSNAQEILKEDENFSKNPMTNTQRASLPNGYFMLKMYSKYFI